MSLYAMHLLFLNESKDIVFMRSHSIQHLPEVTLHMLQSSYDRLQVTGTKKSLTSVCCCGNLRTEP